MAEEIEQIQNMLSIYRSMKQDALESRVGNQDIKRTLGAIATASPDKAKELSENCDDNTHAELVQSLHLEFGLKFMGINALLDPPAELIPLAAQSALERVLKREATGGRPENGYQKMIARFAVGSWQRFGRTDLQCHYTSANEFYDRRGSPLHQWASLLFEIIDERSSDKQVQICLEAALKK